MSDSYYSLPLRCVHLTCKSMLVYGEDFEQDPEYQAGMTEFQCLRTGQERGPDCCEAAMEYCRNPTRPCYQEY